MANVIGGAGVNSLTEDDLSSHPSLTNICNANNYKRNLNNFCFQPLSRNSVQLALEKLNARKACGYDSISPRILRLASTGIADSLTKLLMSVEGKVIGLKHGREESGTQSTKRMTGWMKEIMVQ